MSDSDADVAIPSKSKIEAALRAVVRDAAKQDEELTVRLARTRAEEQLGLDVGFLKSNDDWKEWSAGVIKDAVDEPSSPEKPSKPVPKPKAGAKRKSDDATEQTKKRRKKSPVVESDDEAEPVKDESEAEPKATKTSNPVSMSTSALSSPPDTDEESAKHTSNGKGNVKTTAEDDESELSSVIDDPPPRKKRQPKSDFQSKKPAKSTKSSSKSSKPGKELSPDEEEIKRLQGWLIKCGIRKMWHRELAGCSTPKEKIRHLKGMLEDAGMTGRYSVEKANKIKEERELKAEIEAAKEFNEQWGHDEDDEGNVESGKDSTGTRRRLKPKGLIDFGDSGEDSD